MGKVLALHVTDPGSLSDTSCGPLSTTGNDSIGVAPKQFNQLNKKTVRRMKRAVGVFVLPYEMLGKAPC